MNPRIYLDNNATTPLDPRVLKEMLKDLSNDPLNPSSTHFFGQQGKKLLVDARQTLATFLQVKSHEILFTSGGTESLNLLIQGFLKPYDHGQIISTHIEHACIHLTLQSLKKKGFTITSLEVDKSGAPKKEELEKVIQTHTRLIVLSAVNSETGVKIDLEGFAAIAEKHHIPLVIDGVALLGKDPFALPKGVSGMGFSAHKLHGPKGVGFMFVRSSFPLHPIMLGGNQEFGIRSGTENLSGILGLSKAVAIVSEELLKASSHMKKLRDHLEQGLQASLGDVIINGQDLRISNTTNLLFPGVDGEALFMSLDLEGIVASQGSACSSGALEPSRVLLNMGLSKKEALSSLRFSVSRMNTQEEIERAIDTITYLVKRLR